MSELRKDPIVERWVIISPERSLRPGALSIAKEPEKKEGICPFCQGNEKMTPPEIESLRAQGTQPDTPGWRVRVVPNRFPALGIDYLLKRKGVLLYDMMSGFGAHEVVIESPQHERHLESLKIEEIKDVLWTLQHRLEDLYKDKRFRYLLIFKNKGRAAGASLTHPHWQIIATPVVPKRVKEELKGARAYYEQRERCIFCDILEQELTSAERIIYENNAFVSLCPYAARFPFEIWILPKAHHPDFHNENTKQNLDALADIFKITLLKLDKCLNEPAYNVILHTAPNHYPREGFWQTLPEDFHWHIEIVPRVTHTAGFEWGTGFYINPTAPEEASRHMREAMIE